MIRQVQVVYGYMGERISRKQAERFIMAHNASPEGRNLPIPTPPISRFWCRAAPQGSPEPWIIGWSGPVAVMTPDVAERGAIVN